MKKKPFYGLNVWTLKHQLLKFKNIKTHKNVMFLFIYFLFEETCIEHGIFYYDLANKVIREIP